MENNEDIGLGETGADKALITRTNPEKGPATANGLPKSVRETFEARPDFEAPRTSWGRICEWTTCLACRRWFAATTNCLRKGESIYCSRRCCFAHAISTGRFSMENHAQWKNGGARKHRKDARQDPIKSAARRAVRHAIERGDLVRQPCEACQASKAHGHHDDYSKPLEVRWLCSAHHLAHHRAERKKAKSLVLNPSTLTPDPARE